MPVRKLIVLYILVIIGFFIDVTFLGAFGNFVFKILLLGLITYITLKLWKQVDYRNSSEARQNISDESALLINDGGPDTDVAYDFEPGYLRQLLQSEKEYSAFLLAQFQMIWNHLLPQNGYLIYSSTPQTAHIIYKKIKQDLELRKVSERPEVLSLIEKDKRYFFENQLAESNRLLPYYEADSYTPLSLLAMRSILSKGENLYWIFDSDVSGHFNSEDVETIRKMNRGTEAVLLKALHKIGVEETNSRLEQKLNLSNRLNASGSLEDCVDVYCDFISQNFEASKLTIAFREISEVDNKPIARIYKAIGLDDPFKRGSTFLLDEGLNGWVIMKNKPYLLANIDRGEYFVPRFSNNEKSNYGIRSFLAVPISAGDQSLGSIALENVEADTYDEEQKLLLMDYTHIFAASVRKFIEEDK